MSDDSAPFGGSGTLRRTEADLEAERTRQAELLRSIADRLEAAPFPRAAEFVTRTTEIVAWLGRQADWVLSPKHHDEEG